MDIGRRKKVVEVPEPIPAIKFTSPKKETEKKEVAAPVKERETVGVPK